MDIDKVKEVVEKLPEDRIEEIKKDLYLNSKTKGILDSMQEKVISRKLLVFLTATMLLVYSGLDADTWAMIAMMYIGGQSAVDFARIWKG